MHVIIITHHISCHYCSVFPSLLFRLLCEPLLCDLSLHKGILQCSHLNHISLPIHSLWAHVHGHSKSWWLLTHCPQLHFSMGSRLTSSPALWMPPSLPPHPQPGASSGLPPSITSSGHHCGLLSLILHPIQSRSFTQEIFTRASSTLQALSKLLGTYQWTKQTKLLPL